MIAPFYAKNGLIWVKKKWYPSFFLWYPGLFFGRFQPRKRIFRFFFAISRFFFWISFHISGFFFDKILEDYHDKNSQKQRKWPKFQWCVKFLVTFVRSQSSIIGAKWAIFKKMNFTVFFDIKRRCYLVISENANLKRIVNITSKSRNNTYIIKKLNFLNQQRKLLIYDNNIIL